MEYSGKQKYRNKPTIVDGIRFDSKKEAGRYQELKLLQRAHKIKSLELQKKFEIYWNGVDICTYIADFVYQECPVGSAPFQVVEDVKSPMTRKLPVYRLKKKLMEAAHSIHIKEV